MVSQRQQTGARRRARARPAAAPPLAALAAPAGRPAGRRPGRGAPGRCRRHPPRRRAQLGAARAREAAAPGSADRRARRRRRRRRHGRPPRAGPRRTAGSSTISRAAARGRALALHRTAAARGARRAPRPSSPSACAWRRPRARGSSGSRVSSSPTARIRVSKRYTVELPDFARSVHHFADEVVMQLTGEQGIAQTRVLFTPRQGRAARALRGRLRRREPAPGHPQRQPEPDAALVARRQQGGLHLLPPRPPAPDAARQRHGPERARGRFPGPEPGARPGRPTAASWS